MWIASKYGFFSIVVKEEGFHVRARVKQDLEQLLTAAELVEPIQVWPSADYRYRVIVGAKSIPAIFQKLAESIDYDNFKNMIADTPLQRDKYGAYGQVWNTMYMVQVETDEEEEA
ncbi:hypothetical protein [Rufibacter tibetensis]|uniref:Uncharacterized protein n=1 Tax=Rufibacter tibetensis TaxID=512763 RepID=A0A0P0CUN6_9BACT|nr:hypothetical protein [Rufibacter tibetensis]ALI98079.1 hypothetical protein DC20_02675 [Rufibacter tibetensis]